MPQTPGQLELHGKTVTKMVTKTERKKKGRKERRAGYIAQFGRLEGTAPASVEDS